MAARGRITPPVAWVFVLLAESWAVSVRVFVAIRMVRVMRMGVMGRITFASQVVRRVAFVNKLGRDLGFCHADGGVGTVVREISSGTKAEIVVVI